MLQRREIKKLCLIYFSFLSIAVTLLFAKNAFDNAISFYMTLSAVKIKEVNKTKNKYNKNYYYYYYSCYLWMQWTALKWKKRKKMNSNYLYII